jgi:hypothetical protein
MLNCGANGTLAASGFLTRREMDRPRRGFCRAIAAAVLNDAERSSTCHCRPRIALLRCSRASGRAGAQHHLDVVTRYFARPQLYWRNYYDGQGSWSVRRSR